ncbi:enoyl-CoA hydratase/isomerase family protein [Marinibaculum pumilum]|uniref:Enoyl-CoA hydratase/isomerase family protein n=1 Tax=Marinibaculum pumilum TaxID=1766165 RepID=A0ABV7KW64_9PROT
MDYSHYQCLEIVVENKLATVTFNRPEQGNSINHQFHIELIQVWQDMMEDGEVNAILLAAKGKYFCVGGDVKGMAERPMGDVRGENDKILWPGLSRHMLNAMLECEKPIVCAIHGDCIGLGATVALFTDITVASETARIADPHVKIGLVAGDGGAVIWPLLVGPNRAKEYLMRGNRLNGREAERIGLVNHAVPADEVPKLAREIAQELADGPTWAIRGTKYSVNKWLKDQLNTILDASTAMEMVTFHTEDHREAVRAFAEKRKPKFVGY